MKVKIPTGQAGGDHIILDISKPYKIATYILGGEANTTIEQLNLILKDKDLYTQFKFNNSWFTSLTKQEIEDIINNAKFEQSFVKKLE